MFTLSLLFLFVQDVIIHVKDISHPCVQMHSNTVMETLTKLRLDPSLLDNIIEVNNKMDLVMKWAALGEVINQLVGGEEG